MDHRRTARAFSVSLILVVSVVVIPLVRCASSQQQHANPTMSESATMTTTSCVVDMNPNAPTLCVDSAGVVTPATLTAHHTLQNGSPVVITFKAPAGTVLDIEAKPIGGDNCQNLDLQNCGQSNECRDTTIKPGRCEYLATLNGSKGHDPVIVTDTCCRFEEKAPEKKRKDH